MTRGTVKCTFVFSLCKFSFVFQEWSQFVAMLYLKGGFFVSLTKRCFRNIYIYLFLSFFLYFLCIYTVSWEKHYLNMQSIGTDMATILAFLIPRFFVLCNKWVKEINLCGREKNIQDFPNYRWNSDFSAILIH